MQTRLADYVDYGTFDNRIEGEVIVTLFLKGCDEPMIFHLEGNALRDLAGSWVEFTNRNRVDSKEFPAHIYAGSYTGTVGDLTSSRREYDPSNKKSLNNFLYLEMFTRERGLFVVDSCDFDVKIVKTEWTMEPEDEMAQIMCNQHVLRDYVAEWVRQFKITQEDQEDRDDPLPQHFWDLRLRESEGTAIAYFEVHQKYKNDLCAEVREAFVMGWDDELNQLATSDEKGLDEPANDECCTLTLLDILTDEEAKEVQQGMSHPLFQEVTDFSEQAQVLFRQYLGNGFVYTQNPPPSVMEIFGTLRYITPQVLSCLLQMNVEEESSIDYTTIGKRLARCARRVNAMCDVFPDIDVEGIEVLDQLGHQLYDKLMVLHQEIAEHN